MRRFSTRVFSLVMGVVWLTSNSIFAQIQVGLPTEFYPDQEVSLPLSVADVSNDSIYAFLFTIAFDAEVFEVTGVEAAGDIAEDFALILNSTKSGEATISGAHYLPLQGGGTMIRILGRFKQNGTTDLTFNTFIFNEGAPLAAPQNGRISNTTQISTEDHNGLPDAFALKGNYPNPFNPSTSVQFDLPEPSRVRVHVVDMLGRTVMSTPAQNFQAGSGHQLQLDASSLASGMYVYQIVARGSQHTHTATATMTLIK